MNNTTPPPLIHSTTKSSDSPFGWPSPAENYRERCLDLHKLLVTNEVATFFMKAEGHNLSQSGIHDGDLLIVDRSINATSGKVIVAAFDGELIVRRFIAKNGHLFLENDTTQPINVTHHEDSLVWGVVTYSIHHM